MGQKLQRRCSRANKVCEQWLSQEKIVFLRQSQVRNGLKYFSFSQSVFLLFILLTEQTFSDTIAPKNKIKKLY